VERRVIRIIAERAASYTDSPERAELETYEPWNLATALDMCRRIDVLLSGRDTDSTDSTGGS
jgi:hypothetical protein